MLLHALTVFLGFFAIMNPLANTPIFLSLTVDDDRPTAKSVALRAVLIAFVVVVAFMLIGRAVFSVLGVSLPALQLAGGVVVVLIGIHMLQGNLSSVHHLSEKDGMKRREAALGVAVSPLAMPILAGPGTIATALNFAARGGVSNMLITVCAFTVLCVITYVLFVAGERLVTFIGAGVLGMITRMMGLILAAIGMQMLIAGVQSAFHL
ncbi:MAG: MarC family protein [Thermoleophilia bacterium]